MKYPMYKYKQLQGNMMDQANPWINLGVIGSADVLMTAALTGPMLGMDLATGGLAAAGKSLLKVGGKVARVATIGSKYKLIKLAKVVDLAALLKKFKKIKNLKYLGASEGLSREALQMLAMLKSNEFTIFTKILGTVAKGQLVQANATEQGMIKKYLANNKDRTSAFNALLFDYAASGFSLAATTFEKAGVSIFIDFFQTGLLSLANADAVNFNMIKGLVTDIALKGSEFVPVLGPVMTTLNANASAANAIGDKYRQAKEDFIRFSVFRNAETNLQINVSRLLVLEGLLSAVFNNAGNTEVLAASYRAESLLGTNASTNRIADDINEYGNKMFSSSIHKAYIDCLANYMLYTKNASAASGGVSSINQNGSSGYSGRATCYANSAGVFSVVVDLSALNLPEKTVELLFTLKNRKLYKVPRGDKFTDVLPSNENYHYIKELVLRGGVDGTQGKFNPQSNLTQYQSLVMIINLFYKNQYNAYLQSLVINNKTDQQNRYDFLLGAAGQITPVTGLSVLKANNPITRGQIAELLMKVIYKKRVAPAALPAASVGSAVQYYDRTCVTSTPSMGLNACTGATNFSGTRVTTSTNKWITATIKPSWDVYSTGLKAYGITHGYTGGLYNITSNITRGSAAVLLINTFNYIEAHK